MLPNLFVNGKNHELPRKTTTHERISEALVRGKGYLLQGATQHNKVPTTG